MLLASSPTTSSGAPTTPCYTTSTHDKAGIGATPCGVTPSARHAIPTRSCTTIAMSCLMSASVTARMVDSCSCSPAEGCVFATACARAHAIFTFRVPHLRQSFRTSSVRAMRPPFIPASACFSLLPPMCVVTAPRLVAADHKRSAFH